MTLPTGNRIRNNGAGRERAFTLVELILVMALMIIAVSLVTPTMSRFFAGRDLDLEVNRFTSLTRYAQSRAVSEGIPMLLWLDPRAGVYGLRQETGYTDNDAKAAEYSVHENITMNVRKNSPTSRSNKKTYGIHFSPEGTIVADNSVTGVSFAEANQNPVWVVLSANKLGYEVQN